MSGPRGLGVRIAILVAILVVGSVFVPPSVHGDDARTRIARMYSDYKENAFSEIPDLAIDDARALADSLAGTTSRSDDVVWLDVRAPRERRISQLPGAIDRQTYEKRRADFAGHPVIVYCTIGYRSGLAARDLRRQGVDAYNMAGGILAWTHEGGDVVDGRTGEPTRRVHVYGWRWNLLPEGWKGVW